MSDLCLYFEIFSVAVILISKKFHATQTEEKGYD